MTAKRLSVGYSDSEDRVWLRIEGSPAFWWLTRRLAVGLLRQWGALVERSYRDEGLDVPPAPEDASSAAGAQAARARRAHTAAVATARKVPPVERPAPGVQLANLVVTSIDIKVKDNAFSLIFRAGGENEAIRLGRDEAHRMLAALHARCRRSGWFDSRLPAWLGEGSSGEGGAPQPRSGGSVPAPGGGSSEQASPEG